MSDADVAKSGVSPMRKLISKVVLLILLLVLGVEMRAGLGHMLTGKALSAEAPEGAFTNTSHEKLKSMLALFPEESVVLDRVEDVEYRYGWFSLLRPLLARPEAAYYVVVHKYVPYALRYSQEPPTDLEIESASHVFVDDGSAGSEEMSGFGGDGGGFGGGGRRGGRPPQDPTVTILDKDSDGELSDEELLAATDSLLAADKDGNGTLSTEELRAVTENAAASRQRPELEDPAAVAPVQPEVSTPPAAPEEPSKEEPAKGDETSK